MTRLFQIPAVPTLRDLSEKEWQRQIVELAKTVGFALIYHTYRSERSAAGYPDLVLVRERQVVIEVKRETGKPSPDQCRWLQGLLAADIETYLVRPSDLPELGVVLAARRHPGQPFTGPAAEAHALLHGRTLTAIGKEAA